MRLIRTNLIFGILCLELLLVFNFRLNFEGDWNLVLQNPLDKDGDQKHSNINAKERLKAYMQVLNLSDIFRDLNPSKKSLYPHSKSTIYSNKN